ncbi:Ankyrin repeat protein 2 [Giardia muris]|uniref:Ankyrin repeat protein 2 n=1 Tax=Giardia muris TaxID=5742 RepID=A0A4Z1SLP3_GIAMU|nr:Ankyrin repeat protein 2 [Giardia muris]|eukprot:TNJ26582.1 Ankyrin repeat protein 2 [Giardia muris]
MPAPGLTRAAKRGDLDGIRKHLAYARSRDSEGQTALMKAVEVGSSICIDLLLPLEGGMQDNKGWTALMRAADIGSSYIAEKLLSEAGRRTWKKKGVFPPGTTALMIATYRGATRVIELLSPYEKNFTDSMGHPASWYARATRPITLSYSSPSMFMPRSQSYSSSSFGYGTTGRSPITPKMSLITDSSRGPTTTFTGAFQWLDGSVHTSDDDEQQNFQRALEGDIAAQRSTQSHTNGHPDAKTHMSESSQVSQLPNGTNASPRSNIEVELQCTNEHEGHPARTSGVPVNAGPGPLSPLIIAAARGDTDEVRKCISSAGRCDADGRTALMYAAVYGHTDTVRLIVELEARTRDRFGRTALMYAAHEGWIECVQLLLDEADIKDAEGMTAIDFAETVTEPQDRVVQCTWCVCIIRRHLHLRGGVATRTLVNMLAETRVVFNALNGSLADEEKGFVGSTLMTVFEGALALKKLAEQKEGNSVSNPDIDMVEEQLDADEASEVLAAKQALQNECNNLAERLKNAEEEVQAQRQKLLDWETWSEELRAYCDGIVAERDEARKRLEALEEESRFPKRIQSCTGYSLEELDQLKDILTSSLQAVTAAQGAFQATSCIICLSAPKNTLLQPCMHVCACSECSKELRGKRCPVCRSWVERVDTIFI